MRKFAIAFFYEFEPVYGERQPASDRGRGWISVVSADAIAAQELAERFFRTSRAIVRLEPVSRQLRMTRFRLDDPLEILASAGANPPYDKNPRKDALHFAKQRDRQTSRYTVDLATLQRWEKLDGLDAPPKTKAGSARAEACTDFDSGDTDSSFWLQFGDN